SSEEVTMIRQTMFRRVLQARALTTAVFCSALVLITVIMFYPERQGHAANHKSRQLTFEDRVAAQRAIAEVYHQRRIWPAEHEQPKPQLDEVLPDEAIRAKVEDYLRQSMDGQRHYHRRTECAIQSHCRVDGRRNDRLGRL